MKRGKHPTNKKRKQAQRKVKQYMELREDLQIAGRIPVEPEGAIRDERVDPASQDDAPMVQLVGEAIASGWATPPAKKVMIVDGLIEEFEKEDAGPFVKKEIAKVLLAGDKFEYEKQNPEAAGRARGGGTSVKVDVGVGVQINSYLDLLKMYPDGVPDTIEERINEGAEELVAEAVPDLNVNKPIEQ